MAHEEQTVFCKGVKARFPEFFKWTKVLDIGSMDINGNNRYLFEGCAYIGCDLGDGENVDIVCPGHEFVSLSVTGESCDLSCEHCNHKYLESMKDISESIILYAFGLYNMYSTANRSISLKILTIIQKVNA